MTATTSKLPDFGGHAVTRAAVKISGSGTGLSDGLSVSPIAYDLGEEGYFVIRIAVAGVEHKRDKDENLVREHKFHIEDMAPLSDELARGALQTYAQQIEEAKAQMDGQLMLEAEQAAEERERADLASTGSARDTQTKP